MSSKEFICKENVAFVPLEIISIMKPSLKVYLRIIARGLHVYILSDTGTFFSSLYTQAHVENRSSS